MYAFRYELQKQRQPVPNSFLFPFLGHPKLLRQADGKDLVKLGRKYCHVKLYVTKILESGSLGKMIQNPNMNTRK